jgi:outer membrane biosynthesis protein TonB
MTTTSNLKIARYGIAALFTLLMLFTAVPTFAAKKNVKIQQPKRTIVETLLSGMTAQAAATTTSAADTEPATSTPAATQDTTPTPPAEKPSDKPNTTVSTDPNPTTNTPAQTPAPANESTATTTPVAETPKDEKPSTVASAFTAVSKALTSVKKSIFAKPTDTTATTTATSTGAIASTGIATLFAGPSLTGNVYNSNQFNESETYKLLALALVLAAAGLFLTSTEVFSRTYGGFERAITLPQAQATRRSRA